MLFLDLRNIRWASLFPRDPRSFSNNGKEGEVSAAAASAMIVRGPESETWFPGKPRGEMPPLENVRFASLRCRRWQLTHISYHLIAHCQIWRINEHVVDGPCMDSLARSEHRRRCGIYPEQRLRCDVRKSAVRQEHLAERRALLAQVPRAGASEANLVLREQGCRDTPRY